MSSRPTASPPREASAIIMFLALIASSKLRRVVAFRNSLGARVIASQNPSQGATESLMTTSLPDRVLSFPKYSRDSYTSMRVSELRDLLRENGLAVSGIKAQLVERLVMAEIDIEQVSKKRNEGTKVSSDDDGGHDELEGLIDELKNAEEARESYTSMGVSELRELLRENGLAVSGIKAQLVERLVMAEIDIKQVSKKRNEGTQVSSDDDVGHDELEGLIDELKSAEEGKSNDAVKKPRKEIKMKNLHRGYNSFSDDEGGDEELAGLVDNLRNVEGRSSDRSKNRFKKHDWISSTMEAKLPSKTHRKERKRRRLFNDDDRDNDLTRLLDQLNNIEVGKPINFGEVVFAKEEEENNNERDIVDDDEFDDDDDEFDDDDDEFDDDDDDPNRTVGVPRYEKEGRKENIVTFRDDFQGTRVFVQGLHEEATWIDLKEHFQRVGNVVYASVSIDRATGRSKQCGIVQFETPTMAQEAIREMRNHPMNGQRLYVRKDVQEYRQGNSTSWRGRSNNLFENDYRSYHESDLSTEWKWANDKEGNGSANAWYNLRDEELKEIESLIKKRDQQRRQRNYKMSDQLRDVLKIEFGVHLDDKLKLWWMNTPRGEVPEILSQVEAEGQLGKQRLWRQIPTTVESDSMVDSDHVMNLLIKRDAARERKDFETADDLLQMAHDSPRGGLRLRIHDESRTWRIWTPERPSSTKLKPDEMCLRILMENEPDKADEMKALLKKFPGRELNVFKRLKDRYDSSG